MKIKFTIFVVCLFSINGFTQSFTWQADTLQKQGEANDLTEFYSRIDNTTDDSLTIHIVRTIVNTPENWTSSICFGELCYPPFLDSAIVTLPAQGSDTLIIDIWSDTEVGQGSVTIQIYNADDAHDSKVKEFTLITGPTFIGSKQRQIVKSFILRQNYPNPFNPSTRINYELTSQVKSNVKLVVFDLLGRKISTLVDQSQNSGSYVVEWNGRNTAGNIMPSGVYFYKLNVENQEQIRRMHLVR